jgi:four helix bundle protein
VGRAEGIEKMKARTITYGVSVVRLFTALPKTGEAVVLGKQILRSGTSVGAQYREACRAKSDADFVSKIDGCLQELEEADYWLALIAEVGIYPTSALVPIITETRELTTIFTSITLKVKNKVTPPKA